MIPLLLACAPKGEAIPRPDHDGPLRILAVGDSITHGHNVPGGYRVPLRATLVAAGLDVDFVGSKADGPAGFEDDQHEGYPGLGIDQVAIAATKAVTAYDPDVILVLLGCNDIFGNKDADAPARLFADVDAWHAADPNATIVVATLTPWKRDDPRVGKINAGILAMAEERKAAWGLRLADMHTALTVDMLEDNVHPNEAGYARMAEVWAAALGVR